MNDHDRELLKRIRNDLRETLRTSERRTSIVTDHERLEEVNSIGDDRTVAGVEVELPVAAVQHDALGGVHGDRVGVGHRMGDRDELDEQRPDVDLLAVGDRPHVDPLHEPGLVDAVAGDPQRELGAVDRHRLVAEVADPVFVHVGLIFVGDVGAVVRGVRDAVAVEIVNVEPTSKSDEFFRFRSSVDIEVDVTDTELKLVDTETIQVEITNRLQFVMNCP